MVRDYAIILLLAYGATCAQLTAKPRPPAPNDDFVGEKYVPKPQEFPESMQTACLMDPETGRHFVYRMAVVPMLWADVVNCYSQLVAPARSCPWWEIMYVATARTCSPWANVTRSAPQVCKWLSCWEYAWLMHDIDAHQLISDCDELPETDLPLALKRDRSDPAKIKMCHLRAHDYAKPTRTIDYKDAGGPRVAYAVYRVSYVNAFDMIERVTRECKELITCKEYFRRATWDVLPLNWKCDDDGGQKSVCWSFEDDKAAFGRRPF